MQKIARNDQNAKSIKNAENTKNTCHARTATNAKIPGFNHERLFYHNGLGTNGGAAVFPPGGFQSAAPPLVVRSVLDREVKFCQICFLKFLSKASCNMACSRCFLNPSFFLPRSMGGTGIQRQNLVTSVKFGIFFNFFGF